MDTYGSTGFRPNMHSRNPTTAKHSISWMQLPRLWWASCRILSLRMGLATSIGNPITHHIFCRTSNNAFLVLYFTNPACCLRDGKGMASPPRAWAVSDARPANLSQPSYRPSRLISFFCGVLTSLNYPSHPLCQVLMAGLSCILVCRIWEITWAGDRLIVCFWYLTHLRGWWTNLDQVISIIFTILRFGRWFKWVD